MLNKYFRYPVEYVGISQRYKPNSHSGIDFGWNSAYLPMKIFAAAEGEVVRAAKDDVIGNYVVIKHGTIDGKDIYTQYKHLDSYSVKIGDNVTMSTQIGVGGDTGSSSVGMHLHFDYIPVPEGKPFTQTYRINPEPYLYAFSDMIVGTKGQDGVTIQEQNMTVAEGAKIYVEEKPIQPTMYIVKKGDTLNKIAKAHNMTLREIIMLNPQIKNPNLIYVGEAIRIKPKETVTYVVVKGDTLSGIAKKFGTTVDNLVAKNGLKNPNLIFPGQALVI